MMWLNNSYDYLNIFFDIIMPIILCFSKLLLKKFFEEEFNDQSKDISILKEF